MCELDVGNKKKHHHTFITTGVFQLICLYKVSFQAKNNRLGGAVLSVAVIQMWFSVSLDLSSRAVVFRLESFHHRGAVKEQIHV